jgi:hypothetical protein
VLLGKLLLVVALQWCQHYIMTHQRLIDLTVSALQELL